MKNSPEFGQGEVEFPPIVSEETLEAIRSQYADGASGDNQSWGERLTELQQRIVEENPKLADFIEQLTSMHPPEMHQAIFEVVVGTLVLLERQSKSGNFRQT